MVLKMVSLTINSRNILVFVEGGGGSQHIGSKNQKNGFFNLKISLLKILSFSFLSFVARRGNKIEFTL